jgi:hypothetical protein
LLQTGVKTSAETDLVRRVQEAGEWLLNSGIQQNHGGLARFYRTEQQEYARTSTEISGYGLSAYVYLFHRTGDNRYREAAQETAQFLSRKAWRPDVSAFPFEHGSDHSPAEPLTYFFDTGIIIRGLLAWFRLAGEREYLDLAIAAAVSLANDFQNGHDRHPILQLPRKEPLPYTAQWSRRPGCYQLKSALAWHDLYEITGGARWREMYETSLNRALATHGDFLPAETNPKTMDRLHAFCYFLEGLLPAAEQPDVRATLRSGIDDVSRYLRRIEPEFVRSDVYAQLLRVRLYAESLAALPLDEAAAAEEASCIREFQRDSGDVRIAGGYWFGRRGQELLPFVNPVSTAFCLQALDLWQQRARGAEPDRRQLI